MIAKHSSGNLVVCKEGEALELDVSLDMRPDRLAVPLLPSQIRAAVELHDRLEWWKLSERAFRQLREVLPGFEREAVLVKAPVINSLYSTGVMAIWAMAEHIATVMKSPPKDSVVLVEKIARIPSVNKNFYSFASKFAHFFVDAARFAIYDSYARKMVAYHLGKGEANSYRAFSEDIAELQRVAELSCSLRQLDYYLWLAGNYRKWRARGAIGAEVRGLFEDPPAEVRTRLEALLANS